MKNRIILSIILALTIIGGLSLLLMSQRPATKSKVSEKTYRIGVLSGLKAFSPIVDGFQQRMTELGYVEGKNITYDVYAAPTPVGNEATLKRFIDERVDLIMAFPTESSLEAKAAAAGTGIPVVSGTTLIEGNDFAESVSHPGGNVTGVNYGGTGVAVKRLEALHRVAPKAKRVLVPCMKGYPTVAPNLEAVKQAAAALGLTIEEAALPTADDLEKYLADFPASRSVDAVLQMVEPFAVTPTTNEMIWRWAEARNLPVFGSSVIDDDYGPVVGFYPDNKEMGIMAAGLADKVLRGTPAGTIPMMTAESKPNVNLRVARRLGLTVSDDLLNQSTRTIK